MSRVDLLAPDLGPALLGTSEKERLKILENAWPAIPSGGFEVRLGAETPQVDLQVNLHPGNEAARDWAVALAQNCRGADWTEGKIRLLSGWLDGTTDSGTIEDIWLEFDPNDEVTGELPSIFVGFPQHWGALGEVDNLLSRRLSTLCDASPQRIETLQHCLAAIPAGAFASHVGVMLARRGTPLRLNVKRLFADRIPGFLKGIGWRGDALALAECLAWLGRVPLARLTLCLDIAETVSPDLGIEISFAAQPPERGGWGHLLENLAARMPLSLEKQQAVLNWVGETTPEDRSRPWPFDLVKQSLLASDGALISVERRLSHVKLQLGRDGTFQAKAYLWFGTAWIVTKQVDVERLPYEDWAPTDRAVRVREQSRRFFERTTASTVDHYGTTFQGWLIDAQGDLAASNRILAARAGITDGMRVLDAGCGVCGPAIDIARHWRVQIDAVTNIIEQVTRARDHIAAAGLAERVRVWHADFHHLPFANESFDAALLLESLSSTDEPAELLAAVYRALKPGGRLYIKSIFASDTLTPAEQVELAEFNRSQAAITYSVAGIKAILEAVGYSRVECTDLGSRANGDRWREGMLATGAGVNLSPLGKLLRTHSRHSHWQCYDIVACKP